MRRRWIELALGIAVLTVFGAESAYACRCLPRTLEDRYASAPNVFTAKIVGRFPRGYSNLQGITYAYRFAVLERFKGEIPFKRLVASSNGNACGARLIVGEKYLLFAPDTGMINSCWQPSSYTSGHENRRSQTQSYVETLQAFKAGEIDALIEPWRLTLREDACTAILMLPGPPRETPSIMLDLRFLRPRLPARQTSETFLQRPPATLTILIRGVWGFWQAPLQISAGKVTLETALSPSPIRRPHFKIERNDAYQMLSAMIDHDELRIRSSGELNEPLDLTVPVNDVGQNLVAMKKCVDHLMMTE